MSEVNSLHTKLRCTYACSCHTYLIYIRINWWWCVCVTGGVCVCVCAVRMRVWELLFKLLFRFTLQASQPLPRFHGDNGSLNHSARAEPAPDGDVDSSREQFPKHTMLWTRPCKSCWNRHFTQLMSAWTLQHAVSTLSTHTVMQGSWLPAHPPIWPLRKAQLRFRANKKGENFTPHRP